MTHLAAFRDLFESPRLRDLSARHYALRRIHRGATHRGTCRSASHRAGAAQPSRTSQHSRLARVRFLTAQLHHLRIGTRRCALAQRCCARRFYFARTRPHRLPQHSPGLGYRNNEAEVAKHPFQQEVPQRVFYADGSIGDWVVAARTGFIFCLVIFLSGLPSSWVTQRFKHEVTDTKALRGSGANWARAIDITPPIGIYARNWARQCMMYRNRFIDR